MKEIKLIAFDLDGTLLTTDKKISPRTLRALKLAADRGVALVPSTGRALANLYTVFEQITFVTHAITSNGSAVWQLSGSPYADAMSRWGQNIGKPEGELPDGCRMIALQPLDTEVGARVVETLRPFLPGNLKVFVEGRSACEPECYAWEQAHGSAGFRPGPGLSTVVPNLADHLRQHPNQAEKVCMFFRNEETLHAARKALEAFPDITIVQGAPDNLEITAPGVGKGDGLEAICHVLGIPVEQTMALGDSENDLDMLRAAGFAGVMCNGTAQAKAEADAISEADNDHDGAALLIEKYVLGM